MFQYFPIIILPVLIILVAEIISKNTKFFDDENLTKYNGKKNNADYFEKKNLLTKAEYYFWKKLKLKCDEHEVLICPKVRMEDLVNVKCEDQKTKQRYRGYIKSRHIDYILCDKDLNIIAGIELDDNSHTNKNVKKVDDLKNDVFAAIGVPLIRVKASGGKKYDETLEKLFSQTLLLNKTK